MPDRFYTADDLADLDKDTLTIIAEARGLDVHGTGAGGNVVVEDLEAAISADQDATGVNPALAPQPEAEQVAKRYVVTAPTAVHGHAPGEELEMLIPASEEELLLGSGALRLADSKQGAQASATTSTPPVAQGAESDEDD